MHNIWNYEIVYLWHLDFATWRSIVVPFSEAETEEGWGGVECGDGLPAPRLCESTTVEPLQSVNYTRVIFDHFNHCKFDLQIKLDNNSRSAHN